MTQPTPITIHIPAGKNFDRQIEVCRHTARKEKATVIIERSVERRDGSKRVIPIMEITPNGDVREIEVNTFRVSVLEHTALAHLDYLDGRMNRRAAEGHARLNELGRVSADYIAADRDNRRGRLKVGR